MCRSPYRFLTACLVLLVTGIALSADDASTVEAPASPIVTKASLKVVTLNIAHGRKDGTNQALQSGETARRNLSEVADLLRRIDADVVGLQEADGPSRWSGNFDHVAVVAEAADYPYRIHGLHAKSWLFTFGTALLSRYPFQMTLSQSFKRSPPTITKGFDVGGIAWNPGGTLSAPVRVHVASVHLDFSRRKVRDSQVAEMEEVLQDISGPLIILGDFNADAATERSAVSYLAKQFELQLYEPTATNLGTYGSSGRRLDWILISPELRFVEHVVWPDIVSDHRAVVAVVELVQN